MSSRKDFFQPWTDHDSVYTFAIYVGSSIYTPAQPLIEEQLHVNHEEASLGLALYVLGYGVGGLIFSPLSEIPAVGRNPPYAISGILFVILCVPTSITNSYAGLMILRFLLGFMGSPCLGTVAASFADMWAPHMMPFAIAGWSLVATASPAVGPTLSTYAIAALDWHWHSWILLMLTGPVVLLLICFVPETSADTILYYRARRMRQEGFPHATSEAEQKQKKLSATSIVFSYMIKPWELNVKDPAIFFTTVYMGLLYGILYSFFESLPLVYPVFYNFPATSVALVFLAFILGGVIAFALQWIWLVKRVLPKMMNGTFGELENFLVSGVAAGPLLTIGLFLFAWTSRESVHWIVPTIGLILDITGMYCVSQSIFSYIPTIYPRYAASIFAANSLSRSLFAFAAIMYSHPMLVALGVGGGVSFCAGLMLLCNLGTVVLWKYGKCLRERSTFAES